MEVTATVTGVAYLGTMSGLAISHLMSGLIREMTEGAPRRARRHSNTKFTHALYCHCNKFGSIPMNP